MNRLPLHLWMWSLLIVSPGWAQTDGLDPDAPDLAPEINATAWFNAQPERLHSRPQFALLEFWSIRSQESRKLIKPLNRLYESYGDGRLLIVALTKDDPPEVERFIRHAGIRYKVGAGSRSAGAYNAKEVPTAVLVDPKAKRIRWRASGETLTGQALQKAVEKLLGSPGDPGRSARRLAEEKADHALAFARMREAEAMVASIVSEIISSRKEGEPIEADDLVALDEFYEANLPSDPEKPAAMSEDMARSLAVGWKGKSGYSALCASGNLSESAKSALRARLMSIAKHDPEAWIRGGAVDAFRDFGEAGDEALLAELRTLRENEASPLVRGPLEQTIDYLDPAVPDSVKNSPQRRRALRLKKRVSKLEDPRASPWAEGYAYAETVGQRRTRELFDDYWEHYDGGETEIERDNALLMRLAAAEEITARVGFDNQESDGYLRSNLVDMMTREPDSSIRFELVCALYELGASSEDSNRALVIKALEEQLAIERERYYVRPMIELAIAALRAPP